MFLAAICRYVLSAEENIKREKNEINRNRWFALSARAIALTSNSWLDDMI